MITGAWKISAITLTSADTRKARRQGGAMSEPGTAGQVGVLAEVVSAPKAGRYVRESPGGGMVKELETLGQVELPAEVASVPKARHYVRELLAGSAHARTDDALLLVSELVTNAVCHSDSGRVPGGRVTVAVARHHGTLHCDVIDAGSAGHVPRLRTEADVDSGGGRGLLLVQALATAWGWNETATGRVVWFQLGKP
ncbi:ATP-binding protein [Streptosporangium amethystogenes]|uniref:ATP-binding protein n=1 Tax=Streptosporangium amethystogenes TaxID=2002 RepID=UPI0037AF34DB